MNIEQDMNWIKNSKQIENLDVEICFQLQDNFYTGDPNSHEQLQDAKYHESVELPSFDRVVETMARTSEVIGSVDDLASYYRKIIERASMRFGNIFGFDSGFGILKKTCIFLFLGTIVCLKCSDLLHG